MQKTLVLYASAYGSTRRYAQLIAQRLGCSAAEVRRLKKEMLEGVDTVIFGGWLCGGAVIGAGALCAHPDWFRGRRLIAFVTGSGEYDGTSRFGDVIQDNFSALCPERVFYLKGDLCYRKMRWYHKFLINFMIVEDNKGERRKLRAAQCRWEESQADRLMDYMKS